MLLRHTIAAGSLAVALFVSLPSSARACPFCNAVSQTLSEEIASMDAAIARLVRAPQVADGGSATAEVSKAEFEIVRVIKGRAAVGATKQIGAVSFGELNVGDKFLILGVDPPKIAWSTPLRVSDRAVDYLQKLPDVPQKGPDRLAFFQQYFEDEDGLLARDAYDEFARAPYSEVQALKDRIDRPQLADLVIPDLARWEDWSQVERMVRLFKEADEKPSWVRVPVINYLRACPLPEADKTIRELEKVDPEAVKRANTFFPFGGGASSPAGDDSTSVQDAAPDPLASIEQSERQPKQTAMIAEDDPISLAPTRAAEADKTQDAGGMNFLRVASVVCVAGLLLVGSV